MVQAPKLSPMSQLRSMTSIAEFSRFSVLLIWEEFAAQGQFDAVAFWVGLALDRHLEVDGAHDAVAKLLLDQFLPGRAIDLQELIEAVDHRVGRHRGRQRAAIGN